MLCFFLIGWTTNHISISIDNWTIIKSVNVRSIWVFRGLYLFTNLNEVGWEKSKSLLGIYWTPSIIFKEHICLLCKM